MMKNSFSFKTLFILSCFSISAYSQSYPPQAGIEGSTAIFKDSPLYVAWATGITVERGFVNKSNPDFIASGSNKASYGQPADAIGFPDANVVSLGDEGYAIATFENPIIDGEGFDFAVFENGGASFLELAFVEVSSDGENFFRFPAHSETQTATQIGSFGTPSATYLNNLAGKYAGQYGTPFDLSELAENDLLDKNNITHVKIIDVVGSVNPLYATYDGFGNAVNDSFPTPFNSCGFDLQAVGVINTATLGHDDFVTDTIKIYPNPASGRFYITSETSTAVIVYDVSGRIVLQESILKNEAVNISNLKSGIYLIEIVLSESQRSVQRLIIK